MGVPFLNSPLELKYLASPLQHNALLGGIELDEKWLHWWNASNAEQFYAEDLFILKSPNFTQAKPTQY